MSLADDLDAERFGRSVWWTRPPEPQTWAQRRCVTITEAALLDEQPALLPQPDQEGTTDETHRTAS